MSMWCLNYYHHCSKPFLKPRINFYTSSPYNTGIIAYYNFLNINVITKLIHLVSIPYFQWHNRLPIICTDIIWSSTLSNQPIGKNRYRQHDILYHTCNYCNDAKIMHRFSWTIVEILFKLKIERIFCSTFYKPKT